MKKKLIFPIFTLILTACGTVAINTEGSGKQVKVNPVAANEPQVEQYLAHPSASPLFSDEELQSQKVFKSLTEALKNPQEVYRLEMGDYESGMDLFKLTPQIGELYNLQELKISGVFESFPKELGKLTQLQHVVFDLTNLKEEIPLEISNWKHIKTLKLIGFQPTSSTALAPLKWKAISGLKQLKELSIEGIGIVNFPEKMDQLQHLEKLIVFRTAISHLDPTCLNLSALRELSLINLENLSEIPSLNNSPNMHSIEFTGLKKLTKLPENMGNPSGLSYLRLINCPELLGFPASIDQYKTLIITVGKCPKITSRPSNFSIYFTNPDGFTCKKAWSEALSIEQDETAFYAYSNANNLPVNTEQALKTTEKSRVQRVLVNGIKNPQELDFFRKMDRYINLKELEINVDENFEFPEEQLKKSYYVRKLTITCVGAKSQIKWLELVKIINSLGMLNELTLLGLEADFFTGEFLTMSQLKKLKILGNSEVNLVHNLNRFLTQVPKLENLELSGTTDEVPTQVFNLTKLKTIDVQVWNPKVNYHFQIPASIGKLSELTDFRVFISDYTNGLSCSIDPAMNSLVKLKSLVLEIGFDKNKSTSFTYPDGIEKLSSLQILSLSLLKKEPLGVEKLKLKTKDLLLGN